MKAVIFDNELRFTDSRPVPQHAEGEALIRVSMAGICNTDLEIIKGYSGFKGVIGHEFVGVVEKVNGRDKGLSGKRVVGGINCGCGCCDYCRRGLENHCPDRKVLGIVNKDGCMTEYITLPLGNLLEVPENVLDEEAVFTEPLAAAFEVMEQVHIRPSDKILVMGDGKLGLLISLALALCPADLTLVGKHEEKLEIARKQHIRTALITGRNIGKNYDIVVEATGSPYGLETALSLVRPRGTVVLKSTVADKKEMNLAGIVINEITVIGSRCGPFGPALKALSGKNIDVRPLITGIYPVHRAMEAFEKAREKGALKVILDLR